MPINTRGIRLSDPSVPADPQQDPQAAALNRLAGYGSTVARSPVAMASGGVIRAPGNTAGQRSFGSSGAPLAAASGGQQRMLAGQVMRPGTTPQSQFRGTTPVQRQMLERTPRIEDRFRSPTQPIPALGSALGARFGNRVTAPGQATVGGVPTTFRGNNPVQRNFLANASTDEIFRRAGAPSPSGGGGPASASVNVPLAPVQGLPYRGYSSEDEYNVESQGIPTAEGLAPTSSNFAERAAPAPWTPSDGLRWGANPEQAAQRQAGLEDSLQYGSTGLMPQVQQDIQANNIDNMRGGATGYQGSLAGAYSQPQSAQPTTTAAQSAQGASVNRGQLNPDLEELLARRGG